MKIALYHRHVAPTDQARLQQLTAALAAEGIEAHRIADGDNVDGFDYLFSIGGDGTLLNSVQFVRSSDPMQFPPILGINFGHLGFLTTAGRDNLEQLVADLVARHFTIERRSLLQIGTTAGQADPTFALNEVFLHRSEEASLLRTEVYVDDEYVATYAGDGVIVATPTGSTAYSLSCGGPILTPNSGCFVITPIGAHTLTLRPIIVPDSARLRLVTDSAHPTIHLGMDSRRTVIGGGQSVHLARAPFTIRLIRMNTQNFFSAIRDKLMWGTEVRER